MNVGAATEYLEYIEHATPAATRHAGRELAGMATDRFFFHTWWVQAIAACVAASPAMIDRPSTVLARLTRHFGLRVTDIGQPLCTTCSCTLQLQDVQVSKPDGRCRACAAARPAAAIPTQQRRESVTASSQSRNGGGRA